MSCGGCKPAPTGGPKIKAKGYADQRKSICNRCEYASDGVCQVVEIKYPGKSSIERGVWRPELRCPLPEPKWTEAPTICPRCGAANVVLTTAQRVCVMCTNDDQVKELNRKRLPSRAASRALKKSNLAAYRPSRIKWAVAVTTAPRNGCTLEKCVASIRTAGWEPTIFAEPGSTQTDCETIQNQQRLGCWHNWLTACKHTLATTDASVIMTVQDDSLFHPESKAFSEAILWPSRHVGYLSLYTPSHYVGDGVFRVFTRSMWGACALVFPRESLEKIVNSEIAKTWLGVRPASRNPLVMQRRKDEPHLVANSDTAIGKIVNSLELETWYASPSPVSHIATTSTLAHGGNQGRRNCGPCADHRKPLAEQIAR